MRSSLLFPVVLFVLGCGSSATESSSSTTTASHETASSPGSTNQASFSEPIGTSDDPDMDGILSSADLCPADPEDMDGFQDVDGCPDPDNDGDSVMDVDDQCPNDPETRDGVADADGCPDGAPMPAPVS